MRNQQNFDIEVVKKENIKETLADVKGIKEITTEIKELIFMINNPAKFEEAGAKSLKGALLVGKPGVGKTLIARAIAGEANVNFIFLSGSDFDGEFVGQGAQRIRQLFKTAKEKAPCIVFIDEIDSLLAKSRRESLESSSSRSTINQFLAEMDGFKSTDGVIILGATNHADALDPAAIRPGRFDKKIHIPTPNAEERAEIVDFFLSKVKLQKRVNSTYIAKLTPGFTGADLENLINIATVSSVYGNKKELTETSIYEARDRVMMGIAKKKYNVKEKRRFRTAVHEIGHTYICYENEECRDTLHKVSIVPRGQAEGVTMRLSDDNALHTKADFLSRIDVFMGGLAAEKIIFGEEETAAGVSSDLSGATKTAQAMVKKLAMFGEEMGYSVVDDEGYKWEQDIYSEKMKERLDKVVQKILYESNARVEKTIEQNANDILQLARYLYKFDDLDCSVLTS